MSFKSIWGNYIALNLYECHYNVYEINNYGNSLLFLYFMMHDIFLTMTTDGLTHFIFCYILKAKTQMVPSNTLTSHISNMTCRFFSYPLFYVMYFWILLFPIDFDIKENIRLNSKKTYVAFKLFVQTQPFKSCSLF